MRGPDVTHEGSVVTWQTADNVPLGHRLVAIREILNGALQGWCCKRDRLRTLEPKVVLTLDQVLGRNAADAEGARRNHGQYTTSVARKTFELFIEIILRLDFGCGTTDVRQSRMDDRDFAKAARRKRITPAL